MQPAASTVLGVLAHVDAGKTTLTEALLYRAGAIRQQGRVDHRDTFLDTDAVERARGITVYAKPALFQAGGRSFALIDTPGHTDFAPEMERCLQALDLAVLVVSAAEGIQAHTETIWRLLQRYGVPTLLFLNKADRPGVDRAALMAQLRRRLSPACVAVDVPGGRLSPACVEEIAALDDALLARYLEGTTPPQDWAALAAGLVARRACFPCFWGSALRGNGVEELLWGLTTWALPPHWPREFSARVYQVRHDDKGARVCFLKLTGGELQVKAPVEYRPAGTQEPMREKVDQLRLYNGQKWQPVQQVQAGQLCAVTGLTAATPGMVLGAGQPAPPPTLAPVMAVQLLLPAGLAWQEVRQKLALLESEQPELHARFGPLQGQVQLHIMGGVQLQVLQQVLARRFGWQVRFGPRQILYRETVAAPVMGYGHYEPLRHYAEVHLCIQPGAPGQGVAANSECPTDLLPRSYQNLILGHILEKEHLGILTGSPLTDVTVTLVAGRAHLKHTEGGDFRQATYRAVRQGLEKAQAVLLEPWYSFVLQLPQPLVGRAMADLQQRHGSFEPPQLAAGLARLQGEAPVAALMDYPRELAAYTKGQGSLQVQPAGYRPCHNARQVIEAIGYDKDRDLDNPSSSIFCSHGAGYEVKWQQVDELRHIR